MAKTVNLICAAINSAVTITSKNDIADSQIASVLSHVSTSSEVPYPDADIVVTVKLLNDEPAVEVVETVEVAAPTKTK